MKRVAFLMWLLCAACATPSAPAQHKVIYRPSRLKDCSLEFYGANRPAPPGLVELGTVPLTVGLWSPDATVLSAIAPRACEAGATAVRLDSNGAARTVGGAQRLKDVEVVFLAPPEEQAVTETNVVSAGEATRALISVLKQQR